MNDYLKIEEDGTVGELVQCICTILPQFLEHCYIKQSEEYIAQREKAASAPHDGSWALLHIDFSENYTCVSQDEVQSAHWNQRQVSLFTASLWYSGSSHSRVIVSDDLTHSKETIFAYMDALLEELPDTITLLSVWSDGPASQFKNCFLASGIKALQEKHNIKIHWNFFCTSHGKGPVDGIGGSVKRHVWAKVLSRQDIVKNAESFAAAASRMANVAVKEVKPDEIAKRNEALRLSDLFNQAKAVSGIAKVHFLHVVSGNVSTYILTRDCKDANDVHVLSANLPQNNSKDDNKGFIGVGDWYIVEYEGNQFPGEVIAVGSGEYQVSVMERAGKYWKWPSPKDCIFYMKDKIVSRLDAPEVVNNRGHFRFSVEI